METFGIGSRIKHPDFGAGVVVQVRPDSYTITFIEKGIREIERSYDNFEIIEQTDPDLDTVSLSEIEEIFTQLLRKFSDIQERVDFGDKWKGGKMILKPADNSLQPKEIPMDVFFNKIVMLRDRLRVLEQRINAHDKLSEEDKVNMQQYITRCYGSLTTFNVLFKYTTDYFVGDKGSKD
jgi:DUF438 domain-containing protein